MHNLFRVTILFIGLMFLFTCLSSCSNENNSTKDKSAKDNNVEQQQDEIIKPKNILFYGNSLTAGYGLKEEQSFPSLIQSFIDSLGLQYNVINGGLSGETTSGGKERINWVLKQPLDMFVLELGANDMLRGLDLASTRTNLDIILTRVNEKYPNAKIFLAEMQAAPNMGTDYIEGFRKIYSELANKHKITLIPFFLEGVAGIPSLLLPDGKHPNAEGQIIVANNIWEAIKSQL